MKLRVYATSGPAWQPVKDGKAFNKWVGTIQFSDVEHVMFGRRYYMLLAEKDKEKVIKTLDRYMIGEIVDVPENKLTNPRI